MFYCGERRSIIVDEKNASDNVGCAKVTTIVESTGETRAGKRRAVEGQMVRKKKGTSGCIERRDKSG